jgi:ketosteroid isomerase-like protein
MTENDTLSVVRAYHDAWTSKRFDDAVRLLAPDLAVEVPVNEYPTRESFAAALEGFGSMVESVELLSETSAGHEAMVLYDMDVQGLGRIRVAEHFTVQDGKIVRVRQIHDTAPLREAGFV